MPPIFFVVAFFSALFLTLSPSSLHAQEKGISAARQGELIHLLKQDCGSCHGLTLEGGLGPPLLPAALSGKPPEWLRDVILDGIPGTAMPPWRPILSEDEVTWLVKSMQQGILDEQ
ncbi:MAG TPA: cytochrome c [Gammaproteobacteria bacterium]|nr:cytochrome c [Gammaproteobacteria bacterium]